MSMQDESIISHNQVVQMFRRRKVTECENILDKAFKDCTGIVLNCKNALEFQITANFPYVLPEYIKEELIKILENSGWENYKFDGNQLLVWLDEEAAKDVSA